MPSNILIIDVRSAEEFSAGHIEQAINIPIDVFEVYAKRLN